MRRPYALPLVISSVLCAALLALYASPAAARPGDPVFDELGNAPPKTKPELLLHEAGEDLSAARLDCEVFGWNRAFTQVAAVGSDTRRGPRGKHRGEAFLLVYALGQTLPIHNVICHDITHPDLPHDPIPIEDARDLMWVIENSYQAMWPRRPRYKRPKGAMEVSVLWDPLRVKDGLCTPLVGFTLRWRGQARFQQFVPVDLQVDCRNLRHGDHRVYWGKEDVAAAMARFDFSTRPQNERSARFVVSAAWSMAQPLNIVVMGQNDVPPAVRRALLKQLRAFGAVHFGGAQGAYDDMRTGDAPGTKRRRQGETSDGGGKPGVVSIRYKGPYLDLARYLGRSTSAGRVAPIDDDMGSLINGFPDLLVQLGPVPPGGPAPMVEAPLDARALPGAQAPSPPSAPPAAAPAPAEQHFVPAPMPAEMPDPKTMIPRAPPPPTYLAPIDKATDADL